MTVSQSIRQTHRADLAVVPVGLALVAVGDVEQPLLAEVRADELQCRPASRCTEAAGHRDRRQPGEIGADGVDVIQVHRDRIAGLGAQLEGRRRRGRTDQHIDLVEGALEVVR